MGRYENEDKEGDTNITCQHLKFLLEIAKNSHRTDFVQKPLKNR